MDYWGVVMEPVSDPLIPPGAVGIPVRSHEGVVVTALVDEVDGHLADYRWKLHRGYVCSTTRWTAANGDRRTARLHRQVLGLVPDDGLEGDHISGDKLDNRRSNLRVVIHAQQQQNVPAQRATSRYRGVSWHRQTRRWRALVVLNGKRHDLGYHDREEDAAEAASAFRRSHMTHTNEARRAA